MKCPICDGENPKVQLFCGQCGAPLYVPPTTTRTRHFLARNIHLFGREIPSFAVYILAASICLGIAALLWSSPRQGVSLPTATPLSPVLANASAAATSQAVETPQPTRALQPSETPQPTDTPKPTSAPIATDTPEANTTAEASIVLKPTATSSPVGGLGMTRNAIQAPSEQMGFSFESARPAVNYADQPRLLGTLGNGESFIELIGPPENLLSVGVVVLLPYNNPDAVTLQSTILATVAYLAAPRCKEKLDNWLTADNIFEAADGNTLKTTCGKLEMRLVGSRASDGALITFTVN